ncbi:MAG: hypothetical protein K1000chlam3_00457 [Chlamydiae bacterium]|nr:hypothetical protein [Chlamydiota bacterium]
MEKQDSTLENIVQENWIQKLQKLPNTQKATCSALCSAIFVVIFVLVYFGISMAGKEMPMSWLIIGFIIAEGMASFVFYLWVESAKKLKIEKD